MPRGDARAQVVCVHPGWEALGGKQAVVESWARIFANQPGFIVSCIGARAFVISATAAFVVGTERMPGGEAVATNVFCLENGEWRMMHHQSGQGRGLKSTEDDAEKVRSIGSWLLQQRKCRPSSPAKPSSR